NSGGITGGGIYHHSGESLTITDSTIAGNSTTASNHAGGLTFAGIDVSLSLNRVTISGNTGTGLTVQPNFAAPSVQATNSTISGKRGGGVASTPAGFGQTALQLLNVTIASNSGGAGITAGGGVPPLLVQNTLVANNAAANCAGSTPPALSSRGSNLS